MSKEFKFKHESTQNSDSALGYLESIRDGIAKKTIKFSNNNQEIDLMFDGLIQLKMKGKSKDDKSKFSISLDWSQK